MVLPFCTLATARHTLHCEVRIENSRILVELSRITRVQKRYEMLYKWALVAGIRGAERMDVSSGVDRTGVRRD